MTLGTLVKHVAALEHRLETARSILEYYRGPDASGLEFFRAEGALWEVARLILKIGERPEAFEWGILEDEVHKARALVLHAENLVSATWRARTFERSVN